MDIHRCEARCVFQARSVLVAEGFGLRMGLGEGCLLVCSYG